MRYDDKHPQYSRPTLVYPGNLMGPYPEVQVTPDLMQTWRAAPCMVCSKRTGWREDKGSMPMCSDECSLTALLDAVIVTIGVGNENILTIGSKS